MPGFVAQLSDGLNVESSRDLSSRANNKELELLFDLLKLKTSGHRVTTSFGNLTNAVAYLLFVLVLEKECGCQIHQCMHEPLQVLGLTNYSRDPDATVLRNCIINDVETAKAALMYAIERLQTFAYVGTFETMRESLASWASMTGLDLYSKAWSSNKQHAFSYDDDGDEEVCVCVCQSYADQSPYILCTHTYLLCMHS
jgi:hypothetical protein